LQPGSWLSVLADLRTQINVLAALTIRELQGLMKSYNYGYAWALLEPIMFIGLVRILRSAFKGLTPPDMPPTTFLILGIIPFYLYMSAIGSVYKTVSNPAKLLQFPRVTPVDLAVAAALGDFCIYFVLFCIFAIPISIYEGAWPPKNGMEVLLVFIALWTLGVALGFIFGAINRVFPPIKQFIGYYGLINRMVGGMLFVITMFPSVYWPWLTWNPTIHCSEMLREGWFVAYTSPVADPGYVMEWILGLMLLGLSLERFQRRVPYV
jgi:capsular polysaccharide transport system permease protein